MNSNNHITGSFKEVWKVLLRLRSKSTENSGENSGIGDSGNIGQIKNSKNE